MKKVLSWLICFCMVLSLIPGAAFAGEISWMSIDDQTETGNLTFASGVTKEMCKASYWYDKGITDPKAKLMTRAEIDAWNEKTVANSDTNVHNIDTYYGDTYDASASKESLGNDNPFAYRTDKTSVYINGVTYDKNEYIGKVLDAIKATAYTGTKNTEYAVGIRRTGMLALPIPCEMGWSSTDPDDENCIAVVDVNEPVVIRQMAVFEGDKFYYCYSDNCSGWVKASDLAVCKDKAEWLDAWKVDSAAKDFLVVAEDKIVLEKSHMADPSSEVKLTIGTILKLVPEKEVPSSLGERGTWNNYVVYLPAADESGKYKKEMALISMKNKVGIGYLDYTAENVLDIAFSCLGNRYGWGGCDDAMDCTLYTRLIYKCMGFKMPRNTTWQMNCQDGRIDLTTLNDDQKAKLMETMPVGTLLYWSAHAVMFTGIKDKTGYCINDVGTVIDSTGDLNVKSMYNVILNPLTVRRGDGNSWLHWQTVALMPAGPMDISKAAAVKNGKEVSLVYNGQKLYEGVNYVVDGSKAKGINNFTGTADISSLTLKLTSKKVSSDKYKLSASSAAASKLKKKGCTVKYRFYIKAPKKSSYALKKTQSGSSYTFTGLKKGKTSFKVKMSVYDKNGDSICSKTASKTVTVE